MNLKKSILLCMFVMAFSLQASAVEVWHTPSGRDYEVYSSYKVQKMGKKHGFYMISYKTDKDLRDQFGLILEFYDLMAQFYYLNIPASLRNDTGSIITIEAFREVPKSQKKGTPSRRFTRKFSELKKILPKHQRIDWNRLKAMQQFNKKQYGKALSYFKKIKKKVPNDYAQIANTHLLKNKKKPEKDSALKVLNEGIKAFPKDVTLLNNLAMTMMFKGTFYFEDTYEYDPEIIKNAKETLAKAIQIDNKSWLTKSNMAYLETSVKNYGAAEKLYKEALALSNKSAKMHYELGMFYHKQKKWKKAKKNYTIALKKLTKKRSIAAERKDTEMTNTIKHLLGLVGKKKPLKV